MMKHNDKIMLFMLLCIIMIGMIIKKLFGIKNNPNKVNNPNPLIRKILLLKILIRKIEFYLKKSESVF